MFMREHIRWIGGFDRRSSLHGYMGHTTILYVYTWIDWFFLIHTHFYHGVNLVTTSRPK